MKRMLTIVAVLLVVAATARALPPSPYVGLYADAQHSVMSVYNPGGFFPFELWIWWLPSERGLYGTQCALTYPSNVISSTVISNPDMIVNLGCDEGYFHGTCWIFSSCMWDWAWTHHQACYLTSALPGFIEAVPLSGMSQIWMATCEPGNPREEVTVLNHFAVNQEGEIAVEPQSWGTIRALFR